VAPSAEANEAALNQVDSDFPDLLSQAAAEGFVESDSDSDSVSDEGDHDEAQSHSFGHNGNFVPLDQKIAPSTIEFENSTSTGDSFAPPKFPPSLPSSASPRRAQQTLDSFLGIQKVEMSPSSASAKKTGKSSNAKIPWFLRPVAPKDSAPFYKRIPETTFLVDDFRFIYKDPPTRFVALSVVPAAENTHVRRDLCLEIFSYRISTPIIMGV
jgi:hypothetical protein